MEKEKIKANETYFLNVLTLAEGGFYGWVNMGEVLTKKNGKLQCSQRVLLEVKNIVSKGFFDTYFEMKN